MNLNKVAKLSALSFILATAMTQCEFYDAVGSLLAAGQNFEINMEHVTPEEINQIIPSEGKFNIYKGYTLLMLAAETANFQAVRLLVEKFGASKAKTGLDKTATEIARKGMSRSPVNLNFMNIYNYLTAGQTDFIKIEEPLDYSNYPYELPQSTPTAAVPAALPKPETLMHPKDEKNQSVASRAWIQVLAHIARGENPQLSTALKQLPAQEIDAKIRGVIPGVRMNFTGQTLLMMAASVGNKDAVELLVRDYNASKNLMDDQNRTAAAIALAKHHAVLPNLSPNFGWIYCFLTGAVHIPAKQNVAAPAIIPVAKNLPAPALLPVGKQGAVLPIVVQRQEQDTLIPSWFYEKESR